MVAAIEGPAIGLGATLALFCDIRVAAEDARIGDPHVRVGMAAGDGGALIWPLLIGVGRAKRYLLSGDLIAAPEAKAMGLIVDVSEPGQALGHAQSLAARVASYPTTAVRGTKLLLNGVLRDAASHLLDLSLALEKETMGTQAHLDAIDAFLARSR
jgi:enoyl-CoA hydratase